MAQIFSVRGKADTAPVRVIAAGRASEIVDLGDGRVLRSFKGHGEPAREAAVMEHAKAHGFPVPEVLEVRDDALVLELVDGPTMLADLGRRPWRLARHARSLAALHDRLHEIPYEGKRLLHLDLHPDNVLLSSRGPVVIDWTNAGSGEPGLDVALTWVICATVGNLERAPSRDSSCGTSTARLREAPSRRPLPTGSPTRTSPTQSAPREATTGSRSGSHRSRRR